MKNGTVQPRTVSVRLSAGAARQPSAPSSKVLSARVRMYDGAKGCSLLKKKKKRLEGLPVRMPLPAMGMCSPWEVVQVGLVSRIPLPCDMAQ